MATWGSATYGNLKLGVASVPNAACASKAQVSLLLGAGSNLNVNLACQDRTAHHGDHTAALSSAADEVGHAIIVRTTWPNLGHRGCEVCHPQGAQGNKEAQEVAVPAEDGL